MIEPMKLKDMLDDLEMYRNAQTIEIRVHFNHGGKFRTLTNPKAANVTYVKNHYPQYLCRTIYFWYEENVIDPMYIQYEIEAYNEREYLELQEMLQDL